MSGFGAHQAHGRTGSAEPQAALSLRLRPRLHSGRSPEGGLRTACLPAPSSGFPKVSGGRPPDRVLARALQRLSEGLWRAASGPRACRRPPAVFRCGAGPSSRDLTGRSRIMLGSMPVAAVTEMGRRARAAAKILATASTGAKDAALLAAADVLEERTPEVLAANRADLDVATAAGTEAGPRDRLRLSEDRIRAMAAGLRDVAALPDPVGEVLDGWRRPNGLEIEKVRVPLGVVAIIYENRPNVTSDAVRPLPEIGQRGAPAGIGNGAAHEPGGRSGAAGGLRQGRPARGLAGAGGRRVPRDRDRGHAADRVRGLPDPARRRVADPVHPRARDGAGDHRRRRELPRLRGRRRGPRHGLRHRAQREDPPSERVQRRGVAGRARGDRGRLPAARGRCAHRRRRGAGGRRGLPATGARDGRRNRS